MRRLDDDESENHLKIGIMGDSGSGKTWLGSTAPEPLILIWERQAKAALEASCAVRGLPRPMMVLIEKIADCGNILRAMHADREQPFRIRHRKTGEVLLELPRWPQTLVIDSITDACAMMRAELLKEAPPQKDADSGLPDESYAHRRTLVDRCTNLIRAFRNAPAHVVFLALKDEWKVYRNRKEVGRRWSADLPDKKLPPSLMAACNMFGVMYIRRGERAILLDGDEWQSTKPFPPLRRNEVPDLTELIGRVQGTWTAVASAAPPKQEDTEPLPKPQESATETEGADEEGEDDLAFSFEEQPQKRVDSKEKEELPDADDPNWKGPADRDRDELQAAPETEETAPPSKVKCGHCQEPGHNRRTCPLLKAGAPADA